MCYSKAEGGARCLSHTLKRAISVNGTTLGVTPENKAEQARILLTYGGLKALAQSIPTISNPSEAELARRVYAFAWDTYARGSEAHGRHVRPIAGAPDTTAPAQHPSLDDMAKIGCRLYANPGAPLFSQAAAFERQDSKNIRGYTPLDRFSISRRDTSVIARKMFVDPDLLAEDVIAYDIETDTTNGHGLRPHLSQVTEMCFVSKHETIVLSGDEKQILTNFARLMNALPQGTKTTGWNNTGFDNIFLQSRARFHGIKEWGGSLVEGDHAPRYAPAGGFERPQFMPWTKPDGCVIDNDDAQVEFAKRTGYPMALKAAARRLGAEPIELDRARLHEYTDEERADYVASDGIATALVYRFNQE